MVGFEFRHAVYELTYDQARLLAENLRNYGKGTLQEDVEQAVRLGGSPGWTDGALATAEFIEEILVDNIPGPLPLEGKAAEATFWTLRLMQGLGTSTDIAALRDALGAEITARQTA